MTAENLASMVGIILSLGFSYIPGLNVKYARLDGNYKRLIMAGMLVMVAGAVYGLSCAGLWPAVSCDLAGAQGLISVFIMALIANQGALVWG